MEIMMGVAMLQVLPGLRQLIEGMEPRLTEDTPELEQLTEAATAIGGVHSEWWAAVGVALLVAAGVVWAMAGTLAGMEWRRARRWRDLARYLKTGKGREAAERELDQITLLTELTPHHDAEGSEDWRLLTASERQIAKGIALGWTAQQIADDMACTSAHVYNLRSNIRRKWDVESNQALHDAILERMPNDP